MRVHIILVGLLIMAGCTSYQKISSGAIGCAPNQITVYDVDSAYEGTSWTAVCKNEIYYCFQADSGMGGKIQCTQAQGGYRQPVAATSRVEATPEPQYRYESKEKDHHHSFFEMVFGFMVLDRILKIFD